MRSKVLPLTPLFSLQPILMLWASRMPCLALWLRVIIDTHWHVIISDLFLFTSSVSLSWSACEFAFCFALLFAWSISLVLDLGPVFIVVLSRTSLTMFNVVHVVLMMLLPSNPVLSRNCLYQSRHTNQSTCVSSIEGMSPYALLIWRLAIHPI